MGKWGIGLIVLIAVTISATLVFFQGRSEKRRALRHMQGRKSLTDKEFGEQFFTADRIKIAAKLRQILSRHIPLDLSQLHPDDRLVHDIRMDSLDSLSTVEFITEMEKEFGVSIPDSVAEKMRTLRDVVDYISTHASKENS